MYDLSLEGLPNNSLKNPFLPLAAGALTEEQIMSVLFGLEPFLLQELKKMACDIRAFYYENKVYIRGLIEVSNHCTKCCKYCGIRKYKKMNRYRLTDTEILDSIDALQRVGIQTVVLQGGEDPKFSKDRVYRLIKKIKQQYPDIVITLSLGEQELETYRLWKEAGASRYLLRHETATKEHYHYLHPNSMSFSNRMQCLEDLKLIGYQAGAGMMVQSPKQTKQHLVNDILFMQDFKPDMIGIGPFVPAKGTPYESKRPGTIEKTTLMLALARIAVPNALIPATTALQSIDPNGYQEALKAGANVIMINAGVMHHVKEYQIYNDNLLPHKSLQERLDDLKKIIESVGLEMDLSKGDVKERGTL